MREPMLLDKHVAALTAMHDAGAHSRSTSVTMERLKEIGASASVNWLRQLGLACNVLERNYGGPTRYWLSERGVRRAEAEQALAAAA